MVHNDDDFSPSIFPMGFLGLYFSVQSNMVSWALVSCIGLRGVFDGTVDGLVVLVTKAMLMADCEGQTMYVRYICVSSGAPCAQPHNNPAK
jgi:hypothetical protein